MCANLDASVAHVRPFSLLSPPAFLHVLFLLISVEGPGCWSVELVGPDLADCLLLVLLPCSSDPTSLTNQQLDLEA